ncbi:MAG TPA: zf-HC2 domain-containing protein [Rhodanobacteraceae bacterium]|nr:zf-HC2 domain-containing protein [Rhodanobacteraceae bacterium]
MNFSIDSAPDCARAWEAMPWVLQDSAPAAQKDWLMAHLARCEACSAEFAQQTRLRAAMSLPSDIPLDVELGMARLLKRLDTLDSETIAPSARRANWAFKALAAAVLIQALGIGALGTRLLSDRPAPYRTLSAPAPVVVAGAIRVVPDPGMKLADWNKLLHSLGLKVISGPNAVGAYTVAPADSVAGSAKSLQELRASAGIRLAEPVDNTP